MVSAARLLLGLWMLAPQDAPPQDAALLAAQELYESGAREEALAALREYCRSKPRSGVKWTLAAEFLYSKGEHAACVEFAIKARDAFPGIPKTHVLLGISYLMIDQAGASEEVFRAALERFPENAWLRYDLGLALGLNKKTLEAQEEFEAALTAEPENGNFLYTAAENCLLLGRHDRAEELLRRCCSLEDAKEAALWKLADTLSYQGEDAEAEEWYRKARTRGSAAARAEAALAYAKFLYERQRREQALPLLQEVVAVSPGDRMAWLYLSRCLHGLGRGEESQEALERYRQLQVQDDRRDDAVILEKIGDQLTQPAVAPAREDGP